MGWRRIFFRGTYDTRYRPDRARRQAEGPVLLSRDTETYNIPDRLPVVPLRDVVVFPYVLMPLLIGRPGSLSAVDAAAATPERWVVLVTQRNADVSEPVATDLYRIGVVVRLQQVSRTRSEEHTSAVQS